MRADEDRLRELGFQFHFDLVQVHRTVAVLVGHLDARAEMNCVRFPLQSLQHAMNHINPGHDESGTIAAIGHRDDFDLLIIFCKFSAFRADSLEALGTSDTGVVFDSLTVVYGDLFHVLDLPAGQVPLYSTSFHFETKN